jgi:hypothetical protein
MNALIHIVDHGNKCFKANCLGWRDVINSANDLLTCRDPGRFVVLCNDGYNAVEGEYFLYNSCSLDALPTFGSGIGSRVTRKLKGATT